MANIWNKILSLIGYKEYQLQITWDDGESEMVSIKAWSAVKAVIALSSQKDIANKAEIAILTPSPISKVTMHRDYPIGKAVQKQQ